jgi:hypothetical protein
MQILGPPALQPNGHRPEELKYNRRTGNACIGQLVSMPKQIASPIECVQHRFHSRQHFRVVWIGVDEAQNLM